MILTMTRSHRSERHPLRAVLGLALAIGLLAMCHAAWSSSADGPAVGVDAVSAEGVAASAGTAVVAVLDEVVEGESAGCCALLVACLIAVVGIGAMLMVRGRQRTRVLFQIPAGLRRIDGIAVQHAVELFSRKRPAVLIC